MLHTNGERRVVRRAPRDRAEVFVAVVHAADGLRLEVAAESRAELVRRLAEYVRSRVAHVLRAEVE